MCCENPYWFVHALVALLVVYVMICRFPCLVLVCYLFYFGIGLVSPHVRFLSCVFTAPSPNVFQLLLVDFID
jgi:hypothetical protein